jgi:hypothetical protein
MIIEIALAIVVGWILIQTIDFWLPLVFWLLVTVALIAIALIIFTAVAAIL